MTDAPFDLTETDRLLSTTRAVRKRLDLERPVDLQVVLDCIRLAQQAPTGSNNQGWRFLVVTDPAKRERIAELYRDGSQDYFAAAGDVVAERGADSQAARVADSAQHLAQVLGQVPVHVIVCHLGVPEEHFSQAGYFGSVLPAAWSFQLALRSRGLGSSWTTLHLKRAAEVAELLGIPDTVTQAVLLPVAWTKGTDFKPASRPPVETVTYVDTWGNHPTA